MEQLPTTKPKQTYDKALDLRVVPRRRSFPSLDDLVRGHKISDEKFICLKHPRFIDKAHPRTFDFHGSPRLPATVASCKADDDLCSEARMLAYLP